VDQKDISVAKLNETKAKQIEAEIAGTDANSQLNFMSMAAGKPTDYNN